MVTSALLAVVEVVAAAEEAVVVAPPARQLLRHGSTVLVKAPRSSAVADVLLVVVGAEVVALVLPIRSPNSLEEPKHSRSSFARAAPRRSLVVAAVPVRSVSACLRFRVAAAVAVEAAVVAAPLVAARSRLRETTSSR